MTALLPPPSPARQPPAPPSAGRPPDGAGRRGAAIALGLLGLLMVSAHVRTRALGAGLWVDEGIAIGIASHPLSAIPRLLRQDGSPPLYYALLHGWLTVAGRSEAATHLLSVIVALATVPIAWWLGRTLWGRRAGWSCAVLFALAPLLSVYAQETRMYALVALLSLLATGGFVACFVQRRRRFAWLHALALAALLYTHNWGVFLLATEVVVAAALVVAATRRRQLVVDTLVAFGLPVALYAPWVPTLLYQRAHTGAPWSRVPSAGDLHHAVYDLLGPAGPLLTLAVVIAAAGVLLRVSRERRDWLALAWLAGGTLVLAWVAAHVARGWAPRYLCLLLGPVLLLAGLCTARAGMTGVIAILAVAVVWFEQPRFAVVAQKSNTRLIAHEVARRMDTGDVVLAAQPESVPELRYYLGPGPRYVTLLGPVRDPAVMDWRDALSRLRASSVAATVRRIDRLPPGTHVAFLRQPAHRGGHAPWPRLVHRRSVVLAGRLRHDARLRRVAVLRPAFHGSRSTLVGTLFVVRRERRP